ncbi:hypothetical protein CYY_003011 [Polysphondylium violaceum]|uniref:Rab GTPase n=1 Tax=Polysphondylium violaceum TaxID=133409 RepID=A0A8J4PZ64_9MYCE|nr:hypothetical protein CYY_003011 [Polysphondylium violaceum]
MANNNNLDNLNTNTQEEKVVVSLKCLLLGASGSGKSKALLRYAKSTSIDQSIGTSTGEIFKIKGVEYFDAKYRLCLHIWDKQRGILERFGTVPVNYYKNASAIFIFFDVTDRASFNFIKEELKGIPHTKEFVYELFIVGNKIDLENKRVISREEAIQFAQDNAAQYYEISAKENINVHQMFDQVGKSLFYKKINDPNFTIPKEPVPCRHLCTIQ